MTITKQIKNKQFQAMDTTLAEMELKEKPLYDAIILKTEDKEYRYKVIQHDNGLWYIITD